MRLLQSDGGIVMHHSGHGFVSSGIGDAVLKDKNTYNNGYIDSLDTSDASVASAAVA